MVICFCMGAFFVQKEFAAAEEGAQNDTAIVENQVLVTLTKEETRKFLDYSAEDLTAAIAIVSFYFGGWEQMMQAFAEYWQTFMDGGVPATE